MLCISKHMPSKTLAAFVALATLLPVAANRMAEAAEPGPDRRFVFLDDVNVSNDQRSTGGVTFVDINRDGHLDIYVTNGYDVSNRSDPTPQQNVVYLGDGAGGFRSVPFPGLTDIDGFSSGSSWADYDNDGDLDVFVTNQRDTDNFLLRNDGKPDGAVTFTRVDKAAGIQDQGRSYSGCWVDVDQDGHLDLYVSNGGLTQSQENFLYRNLGDGTFQRIEEGPVVTDVLSSGGGMWADYDNDGDPDLFLTRIGGHTNGIGTNALYRNNGNFQFERTDAEDIPVVGTLGENFSLAAAAADFDSDGDLDLIVGQMGGQRNLLYLNNGAGRFTFVEDDPVTVDSGHSWLVNVGDFDNDGDVDILVGNQGAPSVLYLNRGDATFERAPDQVYSSPAHSASSLTIGDYDKDGDLDAYFGAWYGPKGPMEENLLIRNDYAKGNWLKLKLEGVTSNRSAIGARVYVTAEVNGKVRRQTREIAAHVGWRSQNELTQHIGLGDAAAVQKVEVHWPSGKVDTWHDLGVRQTYHLREGSTGAE